MSASSRRIAALLRLFCTIALLALIVIPAHAVIVRGTVTDPLGFPIANARVQLIQGSQVVAHINTSVDGTYEIRSTAPGRFILLTSAGTFSPNISEGFYGGRTDVITRDIVLEAATVTAQISVTETGLPTPIQQTSSAVTLIPQSALATQVGITNDLRQSPGTDVVQTGQYGGATSLFVRGGNSDANKVLIDGIPADDIGGRFDFGTVSTTGLGPGISSGAAIEIYRGSNSALFGSDAVASIINLTSPRGSSPRPVLNYSGDAGNFYTFRNEATLSGAHNKLDYFGAFSRFDTSNALHADKYHAATSVANLGYNIFSNTQARFTLRNAVSAAQLPGAHDFFGISADAKQADQDIYSGLTVENRFAGNWHNLVRYGIARKREQAYQFTPVGEFNSDEFGDAAYFGNPVLIRGANGYTASGQAAMSYPDEYPTHQYSASNRDELYYQSDYTFPHRITALFGFRYENERGSYVSSGFYASSQQIQRTNFQYTLQFQGDIKNRFFYSLGGAIEKNHLYGVAGTPRIGLAYAPVRPGTKWFHGTRIRASVATGVQEPSLSVQFTSLYGQLIEAGNTEAIAAYGITPINAQRSRTYDIGVDQNILNQKLIFKAGYFHNVFDHQIEYVDAGTLQNDFGIQSSVAQLFGADLNSLAFRAQGIESEIQYQPLSHLFLHGGYTWLDTVVLQSFSSDAISAGNGTTNPNLPGIPIGATSPLVGGRTFRRPPHTGYFAVQYTTSKFSAAFKGALASRSDDSTFLSYSDFNFGNTLLLPNRDLDFGYAKLDINALYTATSHIVVFTQLDNLLGQQHIGPIGYPALPFTFRTGLKIRIGGS